MDLGQGQQERVAVRDSRGKDRAFVVLATLEIKDTICPGTFALTRLDDDESGAVFVFRYERDDDGATSLLALHDEDEYEEILGRFIEIVDDTIEEPSPPPLGWRPKNSKEFESAPSKKPMLTRNPAK